MADKILCPWCGAEMDIKTVSFKNDADEYVWSAWTACRNVECGVEGPYGVYRGTVTEKEAIEAARAAALRRYTPPAKPLTLEELEKRIAVFDIRDGDTYYVERKDSRSEWRTAMHIWYSLFLHKDVKEQYGKTWRCWERKPTDDERSAALWEM